jgi:hypothetical protein
VKFDDAIDVWEIPGAGISNRTLSTFKSPTDVFPSSFPEIVFKSRVMLKKMLVFLVSL